MTQFRIANIGSYPRIGEDKDHQRHRRALNHLQNKEISSHAYHDVEQSVIQEIIKEQLSADLDEVTDGHVSWNDPISHFCRKSTGLKLGGLARFFDTNTYFRKPMFTSKPRKKSPTMLADFTYAQGNSYKPIRTVLTGPYTLATLSGSDQRAFQKRKARLSFFTELISYEISTLVRQGAKIIQIDEPALAFSPDEINLFQKSIEQLSGVAKPAQFILALYFSPLSQLYAQLRSLPVDGLNLDFTYDGKKLLEKMNQNPPQMSIGFGLINGRNTRLEPIDTLIKTLRTWIEKVNPKQVYLTPSCGLEHLPRATAFEKLKLLSKIKNELGLLIPLEKTDEKEKPKSHKLSAGKKKLSSLGIDIPTLPLTLTGSLPKSSELSELKYRVSKGFQQPAELERKEKMGTETWLHRQEKLGINVLVDGELNRGDFISYFAGRIHGFEPGGLVRCYGNRYYKKPIIKRKLEWKEPLIVESWRVFQRTTHHPLKAILTGPYTLMDWSFNEYYSNRDSAVRDLVGIIKKEVTALADVGAKIIQIDEPAITSRPQEFSLISDALKEITKGIKAYFILHHSYGDITPIWDKMQRLPVDNFDLEAANSNFSILPLLKKIPSKKDITMGVIDSHKHNVETPKQVTDNIRAVLRAVPSEQLWLSPDCGLKTRTAMETEKKIQVLHKVAEKIRSSLK